jgi:hypothetical protein
MTSTPRNSIVPLGPGRHSFEFTTHGARIARAEQILTEAFSEASACPKHLQGDDPAFLGCNTASVMSDYPEVFLQVLEILHPTITH